MLENISNVSEIFSFFDTARNAITQEDKQKDAAMLTILGIKRMPKGRLVARISFKPAEMEVGFC